VQQPLGDLGGVLFDIRAGQQYCKFIPTQACRHVAAAHQVAQALTERTQQQIAGIVAVAIVDGLEVVQVDEQQGDGFTAASGIAQRHLDTLDEIAPVG